VAGCLPERYREKIAHELPEVDFFLGTGAYDRIVDVVEENIVPTICLFPPPEERPLDPPDVPRLLTTSYSAYLKIAEGCSRKCTYCIIPKLRGRQRSRMPADIITEAGRLIRSGAKELNLVAQDTTSWGYDLDPPEHPADLLKSLSKLAAIHGFAFFTDTPTDLMTGLFMLSEKNPASVLILIFRFSMSARKY
jgi:ribosomal protein S12 methylthiotransferase